MNEAYTPPSGTRSPCPDNRTLECLLREAWFVCEYRTLPTSAGNRKGRSVAECCTSSSAKALGRLRQRGSALRVSRSRYYSPFLIDLAMYGFWVTRSAGGQEELGGLQTKAEFPVCMLAYIFQDPNRSPERADLAGKHARVPHGCCPTHYSAGGWVTPQRGGKASIRFR